MRLNLFGSPVSTKGEVLGCESCPSNHVPGVHKVKGLDRIKGRRLFIWAQSPGAKENEKRLELVGPAGTLLWDTLSLHGIKREDADIQNVMRCQPITSSGENRDPDKQELKCCSAYNDEAIALNKGNAQVHLILGDVAGNQILGKAFKKDKPVAWSNQFDSYFVLNAHPSNVLRKGGDKAGWDYEVWKTKFRAVKAILDHPGRYGYLKAQNNNTVTNLEQFDAMEREIRAEAEKRRISVDVEDDVINGKRVILMTGFGIGHFRNPKDMSSWTGKNWCVILEHPEASYLPKQLQVMKDRVKVLVEDPSIHKSLQNGSHDEQCFQTTLGAKLRGYDYDTQYGTYLRYSFLRSCKLEDLTYLFFPEFGDYKDIVEPWEKKGFAKAPLDKLILRNCGDCDVTKRLEERFSPEVNQPLVKVYIHAGKTLDKMEERGPLLDWENWNKANEILPRMTAKLDRLLQRISGNEHFNINAPPDVASLIYDVLGLEETEEYGRSTAQPVLDMLQAESGNQTLDLISKRRGLEKIIGTYMANYAKCARKYFDELRTRWALTGAVTGRLRSTGADEDKVNLQNLHGEPLLKNLLVSDKNWRKVYLFVEKHGAKRIWDSILDLEVFIAADGAQIEIRSAAEVSGDPIMIKFLQEGAKDRKNKLKDFHCLNGNALTGFPVERIRDDKPLRKAIKNLIFGIFFGKSEDGIYDYIVQKMREADGPDVDLTGVTPKRARGMHKKFFQIYKVYQRFMFEQRKKFETQGFVETIFGFVRHNHDDGRGTQAGNQAINSPVQGTAHGFVLIALALLDLKPKTYNLLQKCIMEVHDALYFRVKLRHLVEAHRQLMQLFEHGTVEYAEKAFGLKLQVPILAEAEAGFCMSSMIEYEGEPLEEFLPKWIEAQKKIDSKSWEDLMPKITV